MNINFDQNKNMPYDFPSEIYDSFQGKNQLQTFDQNYISDYMHAGYQHSQIQEEGSYIKEFMDPQFDSQFERKDDSFLNLIQNHLQKNDKEQKVEQIQGQNKYEQMFQQETNVIKLSRSQIKMTLLQNQEKTQKFQITNFKAYPIKLKIKANSFKIKISKINLFKNDSFEIELNEWEKLNVQLEIKKNNNQFGDIFQTITIQAFEKDKLICQKFVEVNVKFIKPCLQIMFIGSNQILKINQKKIGKFNLIQNKQSYELRVKYNCPQINKIQFQITTKGYLQTYPQKVMLYNGQQTKLTFQIMNQKQSCKKSILILKPLNSSLNYVCLLTI